jgi:hypothetical protein
MTLRVVSYVTDVLTAHSNLVNKNIVLIVCMQTSQVYVFITPGFLRVQSTNVAVTALRMWLREVCAIREQTQKYFYAARCFQHTEKITFLVSENCSFRALFTKVTSFVVNTDVGEYFRGIEQGPY